MKNLLPVCKGRNIQGPKMGVEKFQRVEGHLVISFYPHIGLSEMSRRTPCLIGWMQGRQAD
jgi:hypothetical protein